MKHLKDLLEELMKVSNMKFKLIEDINRGHEDVSSTDPLEKVYHYTSLENLINILKNDTFIPGPWNNLSTTILKDSPYFKNNIYNVLLVLDYNKLNNKFKNTPYNSSYGNDAMDFEKEIRFTTLKPITNFSDYIKGVILHKDMIKDKLFVMYLQKLGFKEYNDLIKFIKSKISNVVIENINL